MSKTLHLPVKKKWFDLVKNFEKDTEYRIRKPYWEKRLVGREYDYIKYTLGYPKNSEIDKIIYFEYNGYFITQVTHPEFNNKTKWVFAIRLYHRID